MTLLRNPRMRRRLHPRMHGCQHMCMHRFSKGRALRRRDGWSVVTDEPTAGYRTARTGTFE
jgi:hypothetical protein